MADGAPGTADVDGPVAAGRPVVTWLHGYTMDSRIWSPVWELLPGFTHLGVDLPGHGSAPPLPTAAPIDDWARHVETAMRAHGSRLLVALCLGTMVATQVLLRGRIPLDGTVLVAPALVGMPEDLLTANRFGSLAVKAWRGATRAELATLWMRSPSGMFDGMARFPDRWAALQRVIADHTWPGLAQGGAMAFRGRPQTADQVGAAVASSGPLLLVSGGRDMPPQRETAMALADRVAGAQLVDLPDLGHLPILEDPSAVAPAVDEFLSRCGRGALSPIG